MIGTAFKCFQTMTAYHINVHSTLHTLHTMQCKQTMTPVKGAYETSYLTQLIILSVTGSTFM